MAYQWKTDSHIKANADLAGVQCEQLERTIGLTPENLVNANRAENTPLHNEFEWNNDIAADKYRLHQARHIIACLCTKITSSDGTEQKQVRAFLKCDTNEPYYSVDVIVRNEDKYNAMLERALNELKAFQTKYYTLTELTPLFKAIQKLKKCV